MTNSVSRKFVGLIALAMVLSVGVFCPQATHAQAMSTVSWEYDAYEIKVWIAYSSAPELTPAFREDLERSIVEQSWVVAGATWKVTPESAPDGVRGTILEAIDYMTVEDLEGVDEDILERDKVILVSVDAQYGQYHIKAREADCRSRVMGRVITRTASHSLLAEGAVFSALAEAFAPLARIEESKGSKATIRVRAGGLYTEKKSPTYIGPNSIMQPVIRRNDRKGNPKLIEVVDWTYLRVDSKKTHVWDCEVSSAMRNVLAGRGSARTLKFALGRKPRTSKTMLQLVSIQPQRRRDGTVVDVEVPLEGYEIFAKSPLPPKEGEKSQTDRLGRTDWRGMIEIEKLVDPETGEPDPNQPMRLIYVKNGNFLLARLPLIPGLDQVSKTDLTSDDRRLEVEAFVKGMESQVVDIVARRAILAARVRRMVETGKGDEAIDLMEQFASIPKRGDLQAMISERRASVSSPNPREQRRINALLSGIGILLDRFLSNDIQGELVDLMKENNIDFAGNLDTDQPDEGEEGDEKKKGSGSKKKANAKKGGKGGKKKGGGKKTG